VCSSLLDLGLQTVSLLFTVFLAFPLLFNALLNQFDTQEKFEENVELATQGHAKCMEAANLVAQSGGQLICILAQPTVHQVSASISFPDGP
jgi:hypothetical protein